MLDFEYEFAYPQEPANLIMTVTSYIDLHKFRRRDRRPIVPGGGVMESV